MPALLLVEDDPSFAQRMARNLGLDGFDVTQVGDVPSALQALGGGAFHAVVCDIRLPGMDGLELLRRLRSGAEPAMDARIPFVVLTSMNSVETAVEAMRSGASDYLTKESGRAEIALRIRRAIEQRALTEENDRLKARLAKTDEFVEIIGNSPAMQRIKRSIAEVASTAATVMITGETGVGKELVARAIHRASQRAGEFVDINSALLPDDTILQSELFGHERGAFTDARAMKKGKLEVADGGTLFLDEVGELPRETQAKLLRVLETQSFTRLGATRPIRVDVRLVAATNRDLLRESEEGRFRKDLFYRLNVFPIHVPPLRERAEDIVPLARHFLARFAERYGRAENRLDESAAVVLQSASFPGNIRELRNICERLVIRHSGARITPEMLRDCGVAPREPVPVAAANVLPAEGLNIDDLERQLVIEALNRTDWNQTEAARLLGISVDRMNNRVKKFSLTHEKWRVHRTNSPSGSSQG